jgi:hypothetical protein
VTPTGSTPRTGTDGDTDADTAGGVPAPVARPDVRLVAGRLSDVEVAAIVVALSAMSVTSRLEADERNVAEAYASDAAALDGWDDPIHRLPRTHTLRTQPSATAWMFSDR